MSQTNEILFSGKSTPLWMRSAFVDRIDILLSKAIQQKLMNHSNDT